MPPASRSRIEPLNRFETYFLNTAADAAQLCAEVGSPRIGILLDTFHANIEEKSIGAALRGRRRRISSTCTSARTIAACPGSGHVAWPEFFAHGRRTRLRPLADD